MLWPPMRRTDSLEKTLMLGKIEGGRRGGQQGITEVEMIGWHHPLDRHKFELWELMMDKEVWCAVVHGVAKSWTRLSNWTELN